MVEGTSTDDDGDFGATPVKSKGTAKKAAASFDDDAEETEAEAEEVEEAPKKKAKAPTKEDVNEACKAHAKRHSFEETKALLLKKFKTASVQKLKPEQYAAVLAVMKG